MVILYLQGFKFTTSDFLVHALFFLIRKLNLRSSMNTGFLTFKSIILGEVQAVHYGLI